jgi:ABC-2 type transport system ATP-binding protein
MRAVPFEDENDATRASSIEARDVSRSFGSKVVLDRVTLVAASGQVHALLGPNGAGKTTLLRILAGLMQSTAGSARVLGIESTANPRELRRTVGFVPSGDRSFYLRISGLENLMFFARLHGMSRDRALRRSREVLAQVDLLDDANVRVGLYSHGMQKRLSIARALLAHPLALLFDEATHDLDPEGARSVRDLVGEMAREGAAVIWATQRVEEIRGFADQVTVLSSGRACFTGTVAELAARVSPSRWLVGLRNGALSGEELQARVQDALGRKGTVTQAADGDSQHYVLALAEGIVLGDALASLTTARIQVIACREESPEVEEAFLSLMERPSP